LPSSSSDVQHHKQRRAFCGSAVVFKSQFADCASYLPENPGPSCISGVADRHVGANSPRSHETPVRSPFPLLKRLNKGNTLIEDNLSTTDLNESIFQWIRGNRGCAKICGVVDANGVRDQRSDSAAERAFSPSALTSFRGCHEADDEAVHWYPKRGESLSDSISGK
jgi:hypothetical protein